MGEVSVIPAGYGYAVVCSVHGPLFGAWSSPALASFDALGHVAHFHSRPR